MHGDTQRPDVHDVVPLTNAPDVTVRVPGSKSITNRALLCAALAPGRSTLRRALLADDTRAMLDAVRAFGAEVTVEADGSGPSSATITVTGADLARTDAVEVFARQSGTTSRLVLPAAALRTGTTLVDGTEQLRARPFGPQLAALRQLGAAVEELGRPGSLPVRVVAPARGGRADVSGDVSSQFLSGLLLAGPLMPDGLHLTLTTELVSQPYLDITRNVMAAFGVVVDGLAVAPGAYRPADLTVEPDASSASYFFGAAAATGGRVTVEGLGRGSAQGDLGFVDLLERMGATVERGTDRTTVTGPAQLRGIDADLRHVSDTAQTLAAVAVGADGPTRVRGIGFVRGKETDRIRAVVTELRRAGIDAVEHDDGFTVVPGVPRPTVFHTYEDHRMAMSLALLGLRHPGVALADPGCVVKTYPCFFDDLRALRA
ncbi:3-phosphoshikimate 1-carboxyvinyltransferase [Kineosporia sp. A_224]|uniref:3-phosphoshikimate 1-carboxyvinyltransferase n=1 Tax=Kineosporia sp. A_224 TaxID=1962180 RepID=UPI0018E99BF0|nr:3-phosphoshikimate 1-carboxyvinyltransferase [Kineosporia sp. A_224]